MTTPPEATVMLREVAASSPPSLRTPSRHCFPLRKQGEAIQKTRRRDYLSFASDLVRSGLLLTADAVLAMTKG